MLQKFKGLVLLYFMAYSYADEVVRTISIPTIDGEYVPPREVSVNYTGNTECEYVYRTYITEIDNEVMSIIDIENKTICDRYALFTDAHTQLGNNTVEKRVPPVIGITVTLFGAEAIKVSVGLAALGGVAAIGAAMAIGWYTYSYIKHSSDQTVSGKRDYSYMFNKVKRSAELDVCYADNPAKPATQPEAEEAHNMVQQATTSCVNQAISYNGETAIAPCLFEIMDSAGGKHSSTVTAGRTVANSDIQNDCYFHT